MANLTLSVDDELLKQCRMYALQHDTSVNAMVREYLASLVDRGQERAKAVEELNRIADDLARQAMVPEGYEWNREAVYGERVAPRDNK